VLVVLGLDVFGAFRRRGLVSYVVAVVLWWRAG
jgi:hypothetical protein